MAALYALAPVSLRTPRPAPGPAHQGALLFALRELAGRCSALPHLDFFTASSEPCKTFRERATRLLRVLDQALGRRPVFLRPGESATSFDERWLLAVIEAQTQGDRDSLEFLLCRQVGASKRRLFRVLLADLS